MRIECKSIDLSSPLPWGEVDARRASGEGVRSLDRFYALTPTLSPREREPISLDAQTRASKSVQKMYAKN
jgi:hypothetical protein